MSPFGQDDKPRPVAGPSVLSSDLEIIGKVTSIGAIDIGGRIRGEVEGLSLTLGLDGHVSGQMKAASADILGEVDGDITADTLTLRSSARARLTATCKTLIIESGAKIDGNFRKPAPPPQIPAPPPAAPVVASDPAPETPPAADTAETSDPDPMP